MSDKDTVNISLSMIVRNCADDLDKCLKSIAEYVDEIVIVNTAKSRDEEGFTETNDVAIRYGASVHEFPWTEDFSEARNFSFSKCTNDYVMWLDSDDVVMDAERMLRNAKALFAAGSASNIVVEYLYEFDKNGQCTTRLCRERFVDRRYFEWRAPIHECLCAIFTLQSARMPVEVGRVVHRRQREDVEKSQANLERNLVHFEKAYETWDKADTRMKYYWANTLLGLGRMKEARELFDIYLTSSGNDAEKLAACVACAEICRIQADWEGSKSYASQAMILHPDMPGGWLQMAETMLASNDFPRARLFARETLNRTDNVGQEMVCNPKAMLGRPHYIIAYASMHLEDYKAVAEHLPLAKKYYGDDENIKVVEEIAKANVEIHDMVSCAVKLCKELEEEGGIEAASKLAKAVPDKIADEAYIAHFIPKDRPKDKKSIAFVSGMNSEMFGPDSIASGIGGSEEAFIELSKSFAEIGWHVEAYAFTKSQGEFDGVHWRPFHRWTGHRDNQLDVTIWWRDPSLINRLGSNHKLAYLWLHDIPVAQGWTPHTQTYYDKVIALSEYHKGLYPWVDDDRLMVSRNGMQQNLFVPLEDLTNEPHRMIWTSCPSRGLQHLLPVWGKIREAVPDAEIDIYYGWNNAYIEHAKNSSHLAKIKRDVEELIKQPGVNWHGRRPQKEINEAHARTGVWGYPTDFPEISCITAMKAQAHGNIPVCTNDFALRETVTHGVKLDGLPTDKDYMHLWVNHVIDAMKNPWSHEKRLQVAEDTRSNTWKSVALDWEKEFQRALLLSQETRLDQQSQEAPYETPIDGKTYSVAS